MRAVQIEPSIKTNLPPPGVSIFTSRILNVYPTASG